MPHSKQINNKIKRILIPVPTYGFDPTEVAIAWKIFTENNFETIFLSPSGKKAMADTKMLKGKNLGIFKSVLSARKDAVIAYSEMEKSKAFCNPLKYSDVQEEYFDAIFLPGGHDKAVIEYLESDALQQLIVNFFNAKKPVGAICHGVVLVARSIDPSTGKSVLSDFKTTALLKSQELLAYHLTKLWLKDYYLTYPEQTVEDEVKSFLSDEMNFIKGPNPLLRDSNDHIKRGFALRDRNYLSARWPGDIYNFSNKFIEML